MVAIVSLKILSESSADSFKMNALTVLLKDLGGRDKITKLLQYAGRAVKYYSLESMPVFSSNIEAVEKNFSMARKVFRLGKFIPEIKKGNKAASLRDDMNVVDYLKVLAGYTVAFWYLGDHLLWIAKLKIFHRLSRHEKLIKKIAWKFRGIGYSLYFVVSYLSIRSVQHNEINAGVTNRHDTVTNQVVELKRDLVHRFCMILVALKNGFGYNFSDGATGIFGSISSLVVLHGLMIKKNLI